MKRLLAFSVAIALIATACSEDNPTTPVNTTPYLSSTTGTYIVHELTASVRDTITQEIVNIPAGIDSVVVVGTGSAADDKNQTRNAVIHHTYTNGQITDTVHMSQDGSKVWYLYDFTFDLPQVGEVSFGKRWVMIGNADGTGEETGFQETIENFPITYFNQTLMATIKLNVLTTPMGNEQYPISGATVDAKRYGVKISMEMSVVGLNQPIPVELPGEIVLAKDLGLVYQKSNFTVVNGGLFVFEIPGLEAKGVRHMIP